MEGEKEKSNKAVLILGSIALAAVAVCVVPQLIESSSDLIYKKAPPTKLNDNEWGDDPVKIN